MQQAWHVQRVANRAQRQMRGGERHAQVGGDEHHHGQRRSRALGDVFGMAGKGDTRLVDQAFLHRRSHHGAEFAGKAAIDGAIDQR